MTALGSVALTAVAAAPSGEAAKSGPWGFAIILLLCVACYFLFKSMSKQLRKVREGFPKDAPPAAREDVTTTKDERDGGDVTHPADPSA
jgi:hypothetical protein